MPGSNDSFQEWMETFRKEVDAVVAGASSQPGADQGAREAFDAWWQSSQAPVSGKPPDPVEEIARKMDSILYEKAQLEKKLEAAAAAAGAAQEAQSALRTELARLEAAADKARAPLEAKAAELAARGLFLEEQLARVKDDRKFLEEALAREEAAKRRCEEDLRIERERALASSAELIKVKGRLAALEAETARQREALAGRDGTLEELRRQASAYQERLVHAKELTDADVALLRQEQRLYIEELRIMVNTIKKGATT